MENYLALMADVKLNGEFVGDRTKTGCYSVFGRQMRWDLEHGFPLVTTKKVNPANIFGEMLWMLAGHTDLPSLRRYQNKPEGAQTIWSDDFKKFWATTTSTDMYNASTECGGYIYGKQWRAFSTDGGAECDQLLHLIDNIKSVVADPTHPMGRRLIVHAWNPADMLDGDKKWVALPACHTGFQCIVRNGKLNLKFTMRSNDFFLGTPFNIAFYACLTHVLAQLTGLQVGELVYDGTDVHLYSNHMEQVDIQLARAPHKLPTLLMPEFSTLDELLQLTGKDFVLDGYTHHPFIKAPQAS